MDSGNSRNEPSSKKDKYQKKKTRIKYKGEVKKIGEQTLTVERIEQVKSREKGGSAGRRRSINKATTHNQK